MRWSGLQMNGGRLAAVVTSLAAIFLVLTALITPPQVYDQFYGNNAVSVSLQNSFLDDDFDDTPEPDGAADLKPAYRIAFDYSRLAKGMVGGVVLPADRTARTHFATGPPSDTI